MKRITGETFYHAVICGSIEIIQHKEELNHINVFPVADGDTGTNLSSTVHSVMDEMCLDSDLSLVLESASNAALSGARGNSGMILAQFFYGLHSTIGQRSSVTVEELVNSLRLTVQHLYHVISNPVEGTILTLMKAWVEAIERHSRPLQPFNQAIDAILNDTKAALIHTKNQLIVLKENDVVDSGAKGFYLFVLGITNYIKNGATSSIYAATSIHATETVMATGRIQNPFSESHANDSQRYCCEALLTNIQFPLETLRVRLEAHGDSLIMAGGSKRMRIHIHTESPESFFNQLRPYGQMIDLKVDDMALQQAVKLKTPSPIAIVTDSIADLPIDYAIQHQVFVLPVRLELDDSLYLDRVSLSVETFYQMNPSLKQHPKSSLPSIKNTENLMHFLLEHFEHILILSVSDKLSGTYGMLQTLSHKFNHPNHTITVLNTKLNSGAQGLLVMRAVQMAEAGMDLDHIMQALESDISRTHILVAVKQTKYLERSGRISHKIGQMITLLNLKPLMTLDSSGAGRVYGGRLSMKGAIRQLLRHVEAVHKQHGIEAYCIVHGADFPAAVGLSQQCESILGFKETYIASISPTVGATAGEGALAIAYRTRKE